MRFLPGAPQWTALSRSLGRADSPVPRRVRSKVQAAAGAIFEGVNSSEGASHDPRSRLLAQEVLCRKQRAPDPQTSTASRQLPRTGIQNGRRVWMVEFLRISADRLQPSIASACHNGRLKAMTSIDSWSHPGQHGTLRHGCPTSRAIGLNRSAFIRAVRRYPINRTAIGDLTSTSHDTLHLEDAGGVANICRPTNATEGDKCNAYNSCCT